MRRKKHKYARRSSVNSKRKKVLPIVLIAVGAVAVLFAVAVGIGAYLRGKADRYEPHKQYKFEDNSPPQNQGGGSVCAPLHKYGNSIYALVSKGYDAISVSLGTSSSVDFSTDITQSVSGAVCGETDLEKYAQDIHDNDAIACGYFYSEAFSISDENDRRIRKAYEISLLCDAAQKGIDDILILGINVDENNCDEVARYLSEIASAADGAVGIAVNAGVFLLSENEVYVAGKLKSACDFIAMDLTGLDFSDVADQKEDFDEREELGNYLETLSYYISQYYARLIFSDANSKYFDMVIEFGLPNTQVVGKMETETE
ncbi:MAG: hypothetical protein E7667_03940 [Ruminococcaceae bacterium]|nr:hypothetical protein [Oscillospiraceae bacterium]